MQLLEITTKWMYRKRQKFSILDSPILLAKYSTCFTMLNRNTTKKALTLDTFFGG